MTLSKKLDDLIAETMKYSNDMAEQDKVRANHLALEAVNDLEAALGKLKAAEYIEKKGENSNPSCALCHYYFTCKKARNGCDEWSPAG